MKRAVAIIFFVAVAIALARLGIERSSAAYNTSSERLVRQAIPLISGFHAINGAYPKSLHDLPGYGELEESASLLFGSPQIYYRNTTEGYVIEYCRQPLGPHYGYNSADEKWFYSE